MFRLWRCFIFYAIQNLSKKKYDIDKKDVCRQVSETVAGDQIHILNFCQRAVTNHTTNTMHQNLQIFIQISFMMSNLPKIYFL